MSSSGATVFPPPLADAGGCGGGGGGLRENVATPWPAPPPASPKSPSINRIVCNDTQRYCQAFSYTERWSNSPPHH